MSSRQIVVTKAHARRTVAEVVRSHAHLLWSEVRRLVRAGQVRVDGLPCADGNQRVRSGQRIQVNLPATPPAARPRKERRPTLPEHFAQPIIRYADVHIVIVDKPAGLTTMRHQHEAEEFGSRAKKFLPVT